MRKTMAKVGALRTLAAAVKDLAQPGSPGVSERLAALPRMVAAVRSGRYRGVGMGRLGLIAAGVAYVVSPVDVVPEGLLLVAGLADDAMVLSWVAAALVEETGAYLEWEKTHGGKAGGSADPKDETVRSHVVR